MTPEALKEIRERLAEPFPADVVQCRPGAKTKDGKGAAVFWYIDARTVIDRLNDVLSVGGWKDEYRTDFDKKLVFCRLWFKVGDEWLFHEDVGSESDQPDEGDRHKAAVSDSLKRAAVKLGVGRYLYDVPFTTHPFSERGQFFDRKNPPRLPAEFLPKAKPKQSPVAWIVEQYGKAASTQDVFRVDAIVKERNAFDLMTLEERDRADAARVAAWNRTKGGPVPAHL